MAGEALRCLLVGLLANDDTARDEVARRLERRFGQVFYVSKALPFTDTDYYSREMGPGLNRRFALFSNLQQAQRLPVIKQQCMSLERDFMHRGRRRVNIDPGLLGADNLILASGKAAPHRLPLGRGIYGELTLMLHGGQYIALPWTYPDYASQQYRDLMLAWRGRYLWLLERDNSGKGDWTP